MNDIPFIYETGAGSNNWVFVNNGEQNQPRLQNETQFEVTLTRIQFARNNNDQETKKICMRSFPGFY